MNRQAIVQQILADRSMEPVSAAAIATAPSNIALVKYWGKRDEQLHLPVNDSLSISLAEKGACTRVRLSTSEQDEIFLNQRAVASDQVFYQRLSQYLDLFREKKTLFFHVDTESSVPVAAGLASSACGFAALVKALDRYFAWQLPVEHLSILARLGSGSACRSLWHGFVHWHRGQRQDGMDSYASYVAPIWPSLRVGLLLLNSASKTISSRQAMKQTLASPFYACWPTIAAADLQMIQQAIATEDFCLLAQTAESNALAVHASMLNASPSVMYMLPETVAAIQKIWHLRAQGLPLFFTQDAGPNLKLLFLQQDASDVMQAFPELILVNPSAIGECQ